MGGERRRARRTRTRCARASKWSDGEPLTADDIAFTINTSRDQEWFNHSSITANLDATVVDERTVKITSSVPDPKLPIMDVYILPEHIWGELTADDITTYDALDGVGSGPFTLQEWKSGQSWTMVANPNYWQGEPAIDQVIFRVFTNADAMVAALQKGEIDAAHSVPSSSFESLGETEDIEAVFGSQGGFTELAMNGMAGGIGDGHPALLDLDVRHAIHRAIDKDVLFDRVILGLGDEGRHDVGVARPGVAARDPRVAEQYTYDPAAANKLLDDGGLPRHRRRRHPRDARRRPAISCSATPSAARARSAAADPRAGHRLARGGRHRHRGQRVRRHASSPT